MHVISKVLMYEWWNIFPCVYKGCGAVFLVRVGLCIKLPSDAETQLRNRSASVIDQRS